MGQSRQGLLGLDPLQEGLDPTQPLWGNEPKLGRIAADPVDQLGALADQPIAHPHQHEGRLLLWGLNRHEAHGRPAHRLADRLGIGGIVLATLDIWLGQLRRDQLHLVPQRLQQARATAGFESNHSGRKLAEEGDQILAPQLLAQDRLLGGIHPMQLEDVL